MEYINDNEAWTVAKGFAEINKKRQQIKDRLAVKEQYPLSFEEQINIKDVEWNLNYVESRVLNRLYGTNKKPEIKPVIHPINTFDNIFPTAT